jgi:hypothetical protein
MIAESEGEGRGAKFKVLLPYKVPEENSKMSVVKMEE